MGFTQTDDIKEIGTDAWKEQSKDSQKDWSTDSNEASWQPELDPVKAAVEMQTNDEISPYLVCRMCAPGDIFSF